MFGYSELTAAEWDEALRGNVCTGEGLCVSAEEGQRSSTCCHQRPSWPHLCRFWSRGRGEELGGDSHATVAPQRLEALSL